MLALFVFGSVQSQSWKGCVPEDNKEVFLYNVGTGKYLSTSAGSIDATLQEGSGLSLTLHLQDGNYYSAYTTIKNTHGYTNSMLSFSTYYKKENGDIVVQAKRITVSAPNEDIMGWAPLGSPESICDASDISFQAVNGQENTYLLFFRGKNVTILGVAKPYDLSSGACYIYAGEDKKSLEYSADKPTSVGSRAYWKLVSKDEIKTAMKAKTSLDDGPMDVSLLLPGRSFLYGDKENDLWTTTHSSGTWNFATLSGNYCGNESLNNTFDVQQTIEGLPNGVYEVRCSGFGTNGTTYLYANGKQKALTRNNTTSRGTDKLAKWTAIQEDNAFASNRTDTFTVLDHKITLGVRRTRNKSNDWAVWDEFRLYYYGTPEPAEEQVNELSGEFSNFTDSQDGELVLNGSVRLQDETGNGFSDWVQVQLYTVRYDEDGAYVDEFVDGRIFNNTTVPAGGNNALFYTFSNVQVGQAYCIIVFYPTQGEEYTYFVSNIIYVEEPEDSHYAQKPVAYVSQLSNSKVYTATTQRGAWYVPAGSTQLECTTYPVRVTKDPTDPGQQFAIIKYDGKFYIYCVGEKKILNGITSNRPNHGQLTDDLGSAQPVTITRTGNSDYPFFFSFGQTYNVNMNSTGITIDYWTTIDEGNSVALQEVQGRTLSSQELQFALTVAIGQVADDQGQSAGATYNLAGQRVLQPTRKGLYLYNGRKVVVK